MPPKIKPNSNQGSEYRGDVDKQDRGRTDLSLSAPANESRESSSSNRHFPTDISNKSKQKSNSGKRSTTSPSRGSPNRSELQVSVPVFGFPPNADVESLNGRLQKLTEENHVLTDKLSNTRRLLDRREREFIVERQDLRFKLKDWQTSHSDFFRDLEEYKQKLKYLEELEEEVEDLRKFKARFRGKSRQRSDDVLRKRVEEESKERDGMMIRGFNGNNQELEQHKEAVHGKEQESTLNAIISENEHLREELDRHRLYIEDLDTLNQKLTEQHQRKKLDERGFEEMREDFQRRLDQMFRDGEMMRLEYEQKLDELTGELHRLSDILENRDRHLAEAERQIYELRHSHASTVKREEDADSECEIPRYSSAADDDDEKGSQRGRSRKDNDEVPLDEESDDMKQLPKALSRARNLVSEEQVTELKSEIEKLTQEIIVTKAEQVEEIQRLTNIWNTMEKELKGKLDQLEMTDNMISVKAVKNSNRKLTEQIEQKDAELKMIQERFEQLKNFNRKLTEQMEQKDAELKMIQEQFEQSNNELLNLKQDLESGQTVMGTLDAEVAKVLSSELEAVKNELHETKQELDKVEQQYKNSKRQYESVLENLEIERLDLKIAKEKIEKWKHGLLNKTEEKEFASKFAEKEEEFQKIIKQKEKELSIANDIIERYKNEHEEEKTETQTENTEDKTTQEKLREIITEKDNELKLAKEAIEQYKSELQEEKDFYVQSMLTQEKFENILEEKNKDLELANEARDKLQNEIDEQTAFYSESMLNQEKFEKILKEKEKDVALAHKTVEKYKKEIDEVSETAGKKVESDVDKYSIENVKLKEENVKKSQHLKELKEELKKCKESIEKLSAAAHSEENADKKAAKDLAHSKKNLEIRAKEMDDCKRQIELLKRQLEESQTEKQKIEISLAVDQKAAISASKELQEMTTTNGKLERAIVRLKLENEDLRSGNENKTLLLEKESHIRDLQHEVSSLRAAAAKARPLPNNAGSKFNDASVLQHKYEAILTAHRKLLSETSTRRSEGKRRRSSSPTISSHRSPGTGDRTNMKPESSGERIAQLESWLDEIYNDPDVVVHPSTHAKKSVAVIVGEGQTTDRLNIVPTLPELKHSGLAQNRWRNRAVAGRGNPRFSNYEPKPAWDARKTK